MTRAEVSERALGIVHVVPYAMDRAGGVQSHVRDLCRWLNAAGHDASIIAVRGTDPNPPGVRTVGQSRMITLHGTGFEVSLAGPRGLRSIRSELVAATPDVLHFHTPWVPFLAAQIDRGWTGTRVATFHATLPRRADDLLSRWLLAAARRWTRRLNGSLVPSQVPQAQWQAAGLSPVPEILAPAIDLSPWRAAGADRARPAGPIRTMICFGRLEGRKGLDTVLEAWPTIRAALPDIRLLLVGRGTALRDLPPGLTHIAEANDDALRAHVVRADLCLAPAGFGESFGLVLAEAMATGTPVLAAGNPAYRAVLGPDAQDQIFAPGQAADLAARVIALSGNAQMRQQIAERGRARAALADVNTVGPEYVAFYRAALARSNREGTG